MNGQKLREAREKMGLTQTELGELVGTNARQVWRWESGTNDPTSEKIVQLAKVLQISADYLLDLSDNPELIPTARPLDETEIKVLDAMRRGDKLEAIRIIAAE